MHLRTYDVPRGVRLQPRARARVACRFALRRSSVSLWPAPRRAEPHEAVRAFGVMLGGLGVLAAPAGPERRRPGPLPRAPPRRRASSPGQGADPPWQHRERGETVLVHPAAGMEVTIFEPNPVIGLRNGRNFVLEGVGNGRTRLISRGRVPRGVVAGAYTALIEIPHFVMEGRMLLGIKERAERHGRVTAAAAACWRPPSRRLPRRVRGRARTRGVGRGPLRGRAIGSDDRDHDPRESAPSSTARGSTAATLCSRGRSTAAPTP